VLVAFGLQEQISQPAVGVDDAARFYRVPHRGHQACGPKRLPSRASESDRFPCPSSLSGNDNQCFAQIEPSGQALLQTADIASIHCTLPASESRPGSYHGAKQFMRQRPACLTCLSNPSLLGSPNAPAPFFWAVLHMARNRTGKKGAGGLEAQIGRAFAKNEATLRDPASRTILCLTYRKLERLGEIRVLGRQQKCWMRFPRTFRRCCKKMKM